MNRMLSVLCLLITLIILPVGVAYANWQCPDSSLSVSAEWIYFLPTFDQPDYVMKGNVFQEARDVERNRINQHFSSGYRIAAGLEMPSFPSLIVEYTHFDPLLTASKSSPIRDLLPVFAVPSTVDFRFQGTATYTEQFKFDAVDAFFQLYCFECNRCRLQSLVGIKWARLHFTDQITLTNNPADQVFQTIVSDDLTSNVIGPQLGFRGGWAIFRCLTLRGSVQGALFANMTQTKMSSAETSRVTTNFTENPKYFWRVGGYVDSKLGIQVGSDICLPYCEKRVPISVEGGYEFFYSPSLINRICFMQRRADGSGDGLSFDQWSDFTMQGPYVRCNLLF